VPVVQRVDVRRIRGRQDGSARGSTRVERWLALITNQAIRRASFDSVMDLKRKISEFVDHYNQHPRPFMWTATAESILAKLERLCKVINGTSH
jgi:putative transposase